VLTVLVCAKVSRRSHLKKLIEAYNCGTPSKVESFSTIASAMGAVARLGAEVDLVFYSLAGSENGVEDIRLLQGPLSDVPIIVEFARDHDHPPRALELLALGAYVVCSERIGRAEVLWDMFTRARGGMPPYEVIMDVTAPRDNWGFMSMVFRPGSLDLNDYVLAIRPVMDILKLNPRRLDEVDPGRRDLRERVQEAIKSREVLIAQISSQTGNTLYEIGHADALKKRIVILRRTGSSDVPALLNGFLRVEYSTMTELAMRLFFGLGGTRAMLGPPASP